MLPGVPVHKNIPLVCPESSVDVAVRFSLNSALNRSTCGLQLPWLARHSSSLKSTRGSAWGSKPVMIIRLVLFPLGLYLFDTITDLTLAVQYYNSGDFTWFGLTLGFLSVVSRYLNTLYLLVKGKDVDEHVETALPILHLLEAMLESVPQLCLQLYIIIITGEQVSVLKVITMVASLLAAVKAVVTTSYYCINEADRTCSCGFVTSLILLTQTFRVNTVLTLLGNITMVTVWYTLKAGQDWYDVPALVGVIVGSVVSAGLGFISRPSLMKM
ncbi:hypothetical protein Bbelb_332490 [Branchiostoma belcheri]|nr:hypothetical protein Bbelb_332490 [Branchiostoma belcheri]